MVTPVCFYYTCLVAGQSVVSMWSSAEWFCHNVGQCYGNCKTILYGQWP
jgi:hypothetical protein